MEQLKPEIAMRDRLFDAAIKLFARKGYHATSVREIVEAAGVTKPVLYYWFRNKEGVFQHLMDEAVAAHRAILAEVAAAGGPASERILLLGERVMSVVAENKEAVRVLDSIYYGPREGAPELAFEALHGEFDGCLRALVAEAIAAGEFRDAGLDDMTYALLGAFLICKATIHQMPCPGCGSLESIGAEDVRRIMRVAMDGMWAAAPVTGGKQ